MFASLSRSELSKSMFIMWLLSGEPFVVDSQIGLLTSNFPFQGLPGARGSAG